ncbi:MAG: PilZ domain-containing protein [Pseudomonadota bacterium]
MSKSESRRFRRISLNLPAHIVINASDEHEAQLINISPGNMALLAKTDAVPGDAVIIRIKGLDVIEGTVARVFPDGFAVSFILPKKRRALLTERLMLLANTDYAEGLGDRRSSPRHRVSDARQICRLADGASLFVKLIDESVGGVSVDASRRPPVGSAIHIGRQRGVVLRHTPRGFIIVYEKTKEEAEKAPILKAV